MERPGSSKFKEGEKQLSDSPPFFDLQIGEESNLPQFSQEKPPHSPVQLIVDSNFVTWLKDVNPKAFSKFSEFTKTLAISLDDRSDLNIDHPEGQDVVLCLESSVKSASRSKRKDFHYSQKIIAVDRPNTPWDRDSDSLYDVFRYDRDFESKMDFILEAFLGAIHETLKEYEILKKNRQLAVKKQVFHQMKHSIEGRIQNREEVLRLKKEDLSNKKVRYEKINQLITRVNFCENLEQVLNALAEICEWMSFYRIGILYQSHPEKPHQLVWQERCGSRSSETLTGVDGLEEIFQFEKINEVSDIKFSSELLWERVFGKNSRNALILKLVDTEDVQVNVFLTREELFPFGNNEKEEFSTVLSPLGVGLENILLIENEARINQKWRKTFDAIEEPVLVIDKDFSIYAANQAVRDQVGKGKIVGTKCYKTFGGYKKKCPGCPIGSKKTQPTLSLGSNKEKKFISQAYPLLLDREEENPGFVITYRDVSDERNLFSQVVQKEKMAAIGFLANHLAHEFNNPLAGIMGYCDLLVEKVEQDQKLIDLDILDDLHEIKKAGIRCQKIMENLLGYTQNNQKKIDEVVDVNEVVESALALAKSSIRDRKIELQLAEKSPKVQGQFVKLQQVVFNLIVNAAQATEKGGKITLTTKSRDSKTAQLAVIDDGPGIKRENMAKIFDPFFTTKAKTGTGLGLSVSYRIIQELGGNIQVKSKPSQGTSFLINLKKI